MEFAYEVSLRCCQQVSSRYIDIVEALKQVESLAKTHEGYYKQYPNEKHKTVATIVCKETYTWSDYK